MVEIHLVAYPAQFQMKVYTWFIQESIRLTNLSKTARKNKNILFGGTKLMHVALESVCSRFLL